MKIAIVGGRDFNNYDLLKTEVSKLILDTSDVEIVSGGAKGADALAERFAKEFNYPIKIFKAEWDKIDVGKVYIKYNKYGKPYNALAGFIRNRKLVEYSDVVIAFWDFSSHGTMNTLEIVRELNKRVIIVKY